MALAACDTAGPGDPPPDPEPFDVTPSLYDTVVVTPANAATYPTQQVGDSLVFVREARCTTGTPCGVVDLGGGGETTWANSHTWILDGPVYVNDGQTLTIEPGTVVRARPPRAGAQQTALVVARGGRLFADGARATGPPAPIVFTVEDDDLTTTRDLDADFDGAWAGVVLLGRAPTNATPQPVALDVLPPDEPRGRYGGDLPAHNSGVLRYVSIRYAGAAPDGVDETGGLTLAGVGTGTEIAFVEVYGSADDAFAWRGGTVNAHHLVAARPRDDGFDTDLGFTGALQFVVAVQDAARGDRAAEHDSGDDALGGEDAAPVSRPHVYNATYVGSGTPDGQGGLAVAWQDNAGGRYVNSIVYGFPGPAFSIEDALAVGAPDSRQQFEAGALSVEATTFFRIGTDDTFRALVANPDPFGQTVADALAADARANAFADPGFRRTEVFLGGEPLTSVSIRPTEPLGAPRYPADVPAFIDQQVAYRGALDPTGLAWTVWTHAAELDILQ